MPKLEREPFAELVETDDEKRNKIVVELQKRNFKVKTDGVKIIVWGREYIWRNDY